jgi:LmbE family N-acetylglucosaminyl deacetylase
MLVWNPLYSSAQRCYNIMGKIVFVGAHFDDIALAAGGTICKYIDAGYEVLMVVASDSEYTSATTGAVRSCTTAYQEGLAAAKILGAGMVCLNYTNSTLAFNYPLVQAIEKHLKGAFAVYSHHPHDTHQGHVAVANATIAAARNMATVLLFEPFFPSGGGVLPFKPQMYAGINSYQHTKLKALKAHASQYSKYRDRWLSAVTARAHAHGYTSGNDYAECFEVLRCDFFDMF